MSYGFFLKSLRPVTLVGFSLGARLIFKCLEVLAETEQSGIEIFNQ